MKKTYIIPGLVVVQMRPQSAILSTSSLGLNNEAGNALGDGEILVKESGSSDVNVWDDEW